MRAGSLCTGIAGLDMAAHAVYGCELAWYAEYEDAPASVLERIYPGVPNLRDLTTIDWHDVEPVDVLTAGYPCQPFSTAGRRQGANDARHLWPHIAEAVRVLRPRRVVLENVAGHLSLGFGDVLRDLAEAGFDAEWCVLRASDVGAPHQRARLFVVARDTERPREDPFTPAGAPRSAARESGRRAAADADSNNRRGRGTPGRVPAASGPRDTTNVAPDADGMARTTGGALAGRPGAMGEPGTVERALGLRGLAAPDADCVGQLRRPQPDSGPQQPRLAAPRRSDPDRLDVGDHGTDWGRYEPAIARWEHVLGRPAPAPTDDRGRLNPPFVEWMMGYPAGWVDGLSRTQALKALGNAVVPQQGAAAIGLLEDALTMKAAA